MAQLARAPALQAGGRRFESVYLHQNDLGTQLFGCVFFIFHQFYLLSPTCWQIPIQIYKSKLIYKQKKTCDFHVFYFSQIPFIVCFLLPWFQSQQDLFEPLTLFCSLVSCQQAQALHKQPRLDHLTML